MEPVTKIRAPPADFYDYLSIMGPTLQHSCGVLKSLPLKKPPEMGDNITNCIFFEWQPSQARPDPDNGEPKTYTKSKKSRLKSAAIYRLGLMPRRMLEPFRLQIL